MLLDVQKVHFFAQMDITHVYFQGCSFKGALSRVHPTDKHRNTFRGADSSHTLYELLRCLQGGKNSGIHFQVRATQAFKDYLKEYPHLI